jgi:hypothetical protein
MERPVKTDRFFRDGGGSGLGCGLESLLFENDRGVKKAVMPAGFPAVSPL